MHIGDAEGVYGEAVVRFEKGLGVGSACDAPVVKKPGHERTCAPEQRGLLAFRYELPMCMGQMASSLS